MNRIKGIRNILWPFWVAVLLLFHISFACAATIVDDSGSAVVLDKVPQKVVSLVPSATEIIFALGAGDTVDGITHHSSALPGASGKTIVGGFLAPSIDRIAALQPDLVIASKVHDKLRAELAELCPVLVIETRHMEDAFRHIRLMGGIFNRKEAAEELVADNKAQLLLIAEKVAKIPPEKRKRVMRLMGVNVLKHELTIPGSDSFQNEMIKAAGGVPPDFGQGGQVIPVTKEQFREFNPQFLYGCGWNKTPYETLFQQDGWNSGAAGVHGIQTFPCELTCRASSHLGYFVSWLASLIYQQEFSDQREEELNREIVEEIEVSVDLDYVQRARIATSIVHDFANKSLIVDFTSPRTIVSSLEGQRDGISTVGNHYSPPPCWALNHSSGLQELNAEILPVLGKDPRTASFLFTGADMDNLAIIKESYRDVVVYGLVTAGVRGNALRMSRDVGGYYEPGTINMIFLSNMRLTPRAMTRAIISATEGKTAALQDLDIRSSYLPLTASATGTGTDNIIVVQGDGQTVDAAGGHTKLGELLARAAYTGVKEAIEKQNGIVVGRDIFQRLIDRHLTVGQLVEMANGIAPENKRLFSTALEQLLLDPEYGGFVEAAFALSDGFERNDIRDLHFFASWCQVVAEAIGGSEVREITPYFVSDVLPEPLSMAMNAIFTGIAQKIPAVGRTTDDQ